jgi:hypothetical protein
MRQNQNKWMMCEIVKAGLIYFAIVFVAGFILGIVRTLFLVPIFGDVISVCIELPFMLCFSWAACGWLLRRHVTQSRPASLLALGLFALGCLLFAEAAISIAFSGLSFSEHIALYRSLPALIGLLGQILFASFPFIRGAIGSRKKQRDLSDR